MVAMLCLAKQEKVVIGFVAYDYANTTNRVDPYSLLEPVVERTIFGEIIQVKKDCTVPVFCCPVIKSVISQYCGFNSAAAMDR
jgi:hypothetical protein